MILFSAVRPSAASAATQSPDFASIKNQKISQRLKPVGGHKGIYGVIRLWLRRR
jgi:hypothetical protein